MKRIMLMLLITLSFSACTTLDAQLTCVGKSSNPVSFHYGDSELRVTPPSKTVHRGGNFTLRLRPNTSMTHGGVDVTVVGKTAGDQTVIDLKVESYNSATNHRMVWCVDQNQPLGVYSYEITVPGVGKLDPRINVEN